MHSCEVEAVTFSHFTRTVGIGDRRIFSGVSIFQGLGDRSFPEADDAMKIMHKYLVYRDFRQHL